MACVDLSLTYIGKAGKGCARFIGAEQIDVNGILRLEIDYFLESYE